MVDNYGYRGQNEYNPAAVLVIDCGNGSEDTNDDNIAEREQEREKREQDKSLV